LPRTALRAAAGPARWTDPTGSNSHKEMEMKYICSLIVVDNIEKSRKLYEGTMKQRVATDFGENIAFEGGFALHQKDHFRGLIHNLSIQNKSNNFELYFEDDDLEIIEKQIAELDLEFIHRIKIQPWMQKVIRFYDYDGNIIEIGERMQHVAYRLYKENKTMEEIEKWRSIR
jgi:catechol 2,3-dioxygenase-like lactoylglutathione lyase family enzyme